VLVDDGSTDGTAEIVGEYDVRLISTPNQGLSTARNTGLEAATGEIVAYLDDDAWPDPHWLQYLAHAFSTTSYAAFGGPNIPPPAEGLTASCVANAPGGPAHVLLSDVEAEHIPGCNMAFRRELLLAVGGFDPQFTVAGDDVHVCWRLQEAGWKLGFCPAAMVWHHRRDSIGAFRKQQRGYGKAEAMLEGRWPEKYNRAGHLTWAGRVYGKTLRPVFSPRARVYHGTWGMAPFQSIYEPAAGVLGSLALMPEWYLIVGLLAALFLLGLLWTPLLVVAPLLAVVVAASLLQAAIGAADARFPTPARSAWEAAARRVLTAVLHLVQPFSRLVGRIQYGLTPWRARGVGLASPHPRRLAILREGVWLAPETALRALETSLRRSGVVVLRGGDFDTWDMEVHAGLLAGSRLLLAIEDHGPTTQLVRLRSWPVISAFPAAIIVLLIGLAVGAGLDGAAAACGVLAGAALLLAWWTAREAAQSTATILRATEQATQDCTGLPAM
jgi:O-antigen biosynthesis protein